MSKQTYIAWGITLLSLGAALFLKRRGQKYNSNNTPTLIKTDYDMSTNQNLPRGYRNNNPLNIRYSTANQWKGKVLPNMDRNNTFEQFISLAYGYRAALSLLRTYIRKYGCNTIGKIISKWAPETENNTQAYINHVCNFVTNLGTPITADTVVTTGSRDLLCKLAYAMSIVENGNTPETREAGLPNMDIINEAWSLL